MDHEPARALRNPEAHDEDDQTEGRTDEETQAPADFGIEQRGVQQHRGRRCAERGADPEGAVNGKIGPAAIARRDEFLDSRVDRGVFAADAGPGQKTEQHVARGAPRKRGGGGCEQIDRERGEEQFCSAEPVSQPAKANRTEHRASEIAAVGESNVDIAQLQYRALLQRTRHRAGQRHLEPVENPGHAERHHDEGVERTPAQTVQPRRDIGCHQTHRGACVAWTDFRLQIGGI